MRLMGLMLAGPRSRDGAGGARPTTTSRTRRFRFMDHRAMDVAGCPALVNRISYTGDLGYEIWVEPCYLRTLYRAVQGGGRGARARRLRHAGAARRCGWRRTGRPGSPSSGRSTAPSRAAWSGSCELGEARFVGRDAAAREAEAGPRLRRVSLVDRGRGRRRDGRRADLGAASTATTARSRRRTGSARRGSTRPGRPLPKGDARRDGDWRVVGWVTSGGYGHSVGLSLAQGYLPAALAERDEAGLFEVEILGVRRPAPDPRRAAVRPRGGADARLAREPTGLDPRPCRDAPAAGKGFQQVKVWSRNQAKTMT